MSDVTLSESERERFTVINSCIKREITNAVAAARLHLKIRQVQNLKRAVLKHGEAGILHGNKGKRPYNATDEKLERSSIAFLKKKNHRDFGPTFASEKLAEKKHITLSRETVRRIMTDEKLWKPNVRRADPIHRAWRERRALYGELVQFDGCYHDWFENSTEHCLLNAIDDATSTIAHEVFEDNEGVHAVFRFWCAYFDAHGLPVAIYMDRFSTYKINHQSAVDNTEMMTQFQRAMEEIGVKVIHANSPQAKGRVERSFNTQQDRLVKELRLASIKERDTANRFLRETYLPNHNKRFSVHARTQGDAHRPLTKELRERLPSILSIQSKRTVNNDYTIRFKNEWLQLHETQEVTVFKRDTVIMEEQLDGTLHVRLGNTYLAYTVLPERPRPLREPVTALTREQQFHRPAINHPWRTWRKSD